MWTNLQQDVFKKYCTGVSTDWVQLTEALGGSKTVYQCKKRLKKLMGRTGKQNHFAHHNALTACSAARLNLACMLALTLVWAKHISQ
jgi:hypothetical protein